jgi:hypothetical protein
MAGWLKKLFGGSSSASPRVATDTSANGTYSGLRHRALSRKRGEIGIPNPAADAPIWGLLMESGFPGATATIVALADGTTSLYLSSGGGVIGGQGHAMVRDAAAALLKVANRLHDRLTLTTEFPVPEVRHSIFYALTDSGVLTGGAADEELGTGRHPLSPLFAAGHGVITQLRLVSGDFRSK